MPNDNLLFTRTHRPPPPNLLAIQRAIVTLINTEVGSGGGSVGRAVASEAKGPRFESSYRQIILSDICLLSAVLKRQK